VEPVVVAAVQATPVFLDREATVTRCCELVAEAAAAGARIVVFPEAFVPGYPDWVWRTPPWSAVNAGFYARLFDQAVVVPGPETERIGVAARRAGAYVAVGVDEREEHGSTLYNTLLYLGPDGELLARHRKLMPTGGERLVWGTGDGSGLRVLDTPFGRLGGLLCWENYMPLARAALYAQGVDIWLAPTWDTSDVWPATLRHIAKEGRTHVIGVAPLMRGSDIPTGLPGRDELYGGDEDWLSRGLSTIVAPDGSVLAGPLVETEGVLTARLDPCAARAARQQFDPVGHYARPDVFALHVDVRERTPVTFSFAPPPSNPWTHPPLDPPL
jgi:nitrilase